MKRFLFLVTAAMLVAGCGKIAPLEPAPGHHLPVKPATASRTPTADELFALRADAAPARVDELVTKSMPRRADRFDLPPPDGGAPALPAGTASPPSATAPTSLQPSDNQIAPGNSQ